MQQKLNWITENNIEFFPENVVTFSELSSDSYAIENHEMRGVYFRKLIEQTDELLFLDDSISTEILNLIKDFWTNKSKYFEFNYLWKRGFLLYGPPGSGKSSTIALIRREFIKLGGIIFYTHRYFEITLKAITEFRKRNPDQAIMLIVEDVENAFQSWNDGAKFLSFLEGEAQIQNIVVIATTNNINQIPESIRCRPGRFDIVKYVGAPTIDARTQYILTKFPQIINNPLFVKIINDTDGFYFSHMKELIISLFCLNNDYKETITRLRELIIKNEEEYMQKKDNSSTKPTTDGGHDAPTPAGKHLKIKESQ